MMDQGWTETELDQRLAELKATSQVDLVLRIGLLIFALCCLGSWLFLDIQWQHPVTQKPLLEINESFYQDLIPYPLRQEVRGEWEFDAAKLGAWLKEVFMEAGWPALKTTLALSVVAIFLGSIMAVLIALPRAARLLGQSMRLMSDVKERSFGHLALQFLAALSPPCSLVFRAIPEFVWAFLMLVVMGPVMMTGALALAIHNAGILAKLGFETIEDMDQRPNHALSALGARPSVTAFFAATPGVMQRCLVYFFYRWETCIRESVILGVLGIGTIGFHIHHAFNQFQYDKAIVFIAMNSMLVIVADQISAQVRRRIRVLEAGH